jgi:hypothetical protein
MVRVFLIFFSFLPPFRPSASIHGEDLTPEGREAGTMRARLIHFQNRLFFFLLTFSLTRDAEGG